MMAVGSTGADTGPAETLEDVSAGAVPAKVAGGSVGAEAVPAETPEDVSAGAVPAVEGAGGPMARSSSSSDVSEASPDASLAATNEKPGASSAGNSCVRPPKSLCSTVSSAKYPLHLVQWGLFTRWYLDPQS